MKTLTTPYLKRKRRELLEKLPNLAHILRGSLIERYKRCGKPGCKCLKNRGHGPKFYLSISQTGQKPHMDYIPQALEKEVAEYLGNYRTVREILEEICQINLELIRRREKSQ